jgi:prepilin-type N-terminal cleavage/methylation domain-containing protein
MTQTSTTEQGLSLLECMMAIVVIGLTAAMITPPLFLAAATRVQNRRAEQSFQLAQGEVDRIQVLVALGQHTPARLPFATGGQLGLVTPPTTLSTQLDSVNSTCNTYNDQPLGVNIGRRIDIDGDCQMDYFLQAFRSPGTISSRDNSNSRLTEFKLGVRVYTALAANNLGQLRPEQASLQFTNGLGSQTTRPLSVLMTDIYWSDRSSTLCRYNNRVGCTP